MVALVGPALFVAALLAISLASAPSRPEGRRPAELAPDRVAGALPPGPFNAPAGTVRAAGGLQGQGMADSTPPVRRSAEPARDETVQRERLADRAATSPGTTLDRCQRIRRLAEESCRKQIFPDQDAPMSECVRRELRYTLWSIYGCR